MLAEKGLMSTLEEIGSKIYHLDDIDSVMRKLGVRIVGDRIEKIPTAWEEFNKTMMEYEVASAGHESDCQCDVCSTLRRFGVLPAQRIKKEMVQ